MPINLSDLKKKKVAVWGFGVNNQHLAKWLVKKGVQVTICDENEKAITAQPDLKSKVDWKLGEQAFSNLIDFHYIFRTPGIRPDHKSIVEAQTRGGAILTSQTELFFYLCQAPIVGVTGTKGKGTTASLLFSMMKEGTATSPFNQIYLAGNIGRDPFEFLDEIKVEDLVILELSSFQLFQAEIRPKVAIVLSLSPDHLDYHKNIHEYVAAKSYLVRNQEVEDIAILHQESQHLQSFKTLTKAQIYTFSRQRRVSRGTYVSQNDKNIYITGESQPLLKASNLSIQGEHNLENAAAASLAAYLLGASRQAIARGAKSFVGLPHRLQKVYETKGVKFIDDSIATTPESTMAAISTFADSPIHLIAGGVAKGADYRAMGKEIDKSCESVTLIGRDAKMIAEHLKNKYNLVANMEAAIRLILPKVKKGHVVLLSPACASFDLYKNYAERGDDFKKRAENNARLIHE